MIIAGFVVGSTMLVVGCDKPNPPNPQSHAQVAQPVKLEPSRPPQPERKLADIRQCAKDAQEYLSPTAGKGAVSNHWDGSRCLLRYDVVLEKGDEVVVNLLDIYENHRVGDMARLKWSEAAKNYLPVDGENARRLAAIESAMSK
jgi:hypothetical protein